jgi:hypothetical protein
MRPQPCEYCPCPVICLRREDFCGWAANGERIDHIVNRSAIANEDPDALFARLEAARLAWEAFPPDQRRSGCCNGAADKII